MSGPKHLYAHFRAVPGVRAAVADLVATYRADVTAEPGNVLFEAHTLRSDPDMFFVYEVYADDPAFDAHVGSAHCAAFNDGIASLVEGGQSTLTWLEPVSG